MNKVIKFAKQFIGKNGSKFNSWYWGKDTGTAWCAVFASYIYYMTGDKLTGKHATKKGYAYVPYIPMDMSKSSKPKVGDLVIFDWNLSGVGDHVGVISSISGNNITTIEGNKNNSVGYRTFPKNWSYVLNILTPKTTPVAAKATTDSKKTTTTTATTKPAATTPTTDTTYITKKVVPLIGLNERKGPGTNFDIVRSYAKGTKIKVLAIKKSKQPVLFNKAWYKTNKGGYVHGSYLK